MALTSQALKYTPLRDIHVALGAKMVPFAGFEMPVQYPTGITAEHKAVREGCGIFDVCHMGEFIVRGPGAMDFVNHVTTNDVMALAEGQAHYSTILNDRGTIEDDCLIYRYADHIMMVVNGANVAKDFAHVASQRQRFECTLENVSDQVALLAIQGPHAAKVLQRYTATDLSVISYYHFTEGHVDEVACTISRTGYTGEDGFELYFDATLAPRIWNALTAAGDVAPAGLGCRDSLRLEMGMALYGNDIDDGTTPLEANLGWLVKLKKGDFVGRDALVAQKAAGVARTLVGFTMPDRAFPRPGYAVFYQSSPSGIVRSGTLSPSLGVPIGMCYLPPAAATVGTRFEVEIRGQRLAATVAAIPFYKQGSHR